MFRLGLMLVLLCIGRAALAAAQWGVEGLRSTASRRFWSASKKFGVHELVLSGGGEVANPFAIDATVTFTPESGVDEAVTVKAFYDGKNMWRARLYVSEIGRRSATSELPWAGQQPSKIEEQGVKTS